MNLKGLDMSLRLLPSLSLAAVAVLALAGPASADEPDVPGEVLPTISAECGQDAVYDTIVHPAVYEQLPAVTHLEWTWQRSVPTTEVRWARTVTPAQGEWSWSRSVDVLERRYVVRIIDRAHVPAVPESGHWETRVIPGTAGLLVEYVHHQSGRTRWEIEGWNAGAGGLGWSPTGNTQDTTQTEQVWVVDQAAVPEVAELAHDEDVWVLDGAAAPADASGPHESRVASSTPEQVSLPEGESPAGAGWVRGLFTETVAAIIDSLWLPQGQVADAPYAVTTDTQPGTPVDEVTPVASAAAPAGDGWTQVSGSEVTVIDVPAGPGALLEPAWVEDFIVSPATDPCPVDEVDGVEDVDGADGENGAGGETDNGGPHGVEGLEVEAAVATDAGVLPDTGAPVGLWGVVLGAGGVMGGLSLVARSRRPA